jgi:uncharacterized protein
MFYQRTLKNQIVEALNNFPVVLISGARQVGKSTLALDLMPNYITLDDISIYSSLQADPVTFIKMLDKPVAIDEVQKMTSIFNAIKLDVDRNRVNGKYLLTGSANIMAYKDLSESLAGRIALLELLPLSQCELNNTNADPLVPFKPSDPLDLLFNFAPDQLKNYQISSETIISKVISGGYPEIQKITTPRGRYQWFSSYIRTYIERDIRDIGELRNLDKFIRMYSLLASRSGSLLNKVDIARDSGINLKTLDNYLELLKLIYQVNILQPYSANIDKRLIKTGKLYFTDSGVLAHLLQITTEQEFRSSAFGGQLFETFIYSELLKAATYSELPTNIYFFRTTEQHEIDFIVERQGHIVALECKLAQSVRRQDFRHLAYLASKTNNFKAGYLLYLGDQILPFGHNLYALPVSAIC